MRSQSLVVASIVVSMSLVVAAVACEHPVADRVRLLEAVPQPVPLVLGGPPTVLKTVVALRPVAGLRAAEHWDGDDGRCGECGEEDRDDRHDKRRQTTRWIAELTWELQDDRGQAVSRSTTSEAVVPPFT